MRLEIQWREGDVELPILVQPRSAREEVGGVHEGALRVRVHAPPVGGEANAAVARAVAKALGISPSRVQIVSGQRGRRKRLRIASASPALEQAVQELASKPRKV